MSIYEHFEAVPSRILGITRLLAASTNMMRTHKDLIDLMQPTDEKANIAKAVIKAALKVNLLTEELREGKKYLTLSSHLDGYIGNPDRVRDDFPDIMTRLLLKPVNGQKRNRFAKACAWLLTLPVTQVPQGHTDLKNMMDAQGLDLDKLGLNNDARWDVLIDWVKYIGLAWQTHEGKCMGFVPDPTAFIIRHRDKLLPPDKEITAESFREILGEICPVLDGGDVRENVLKTMHIQNPAVQQWPEDRLSDSLSFALRRIKKQGLLDYWCPDDQRTFLLMSRDEKIAYLSCSPRKT